MLVHDLPNPLATVNMCAQLLLRDAHSDNLHEGLSNIQEAALRPRGQAGRSGHTALEATIYTFAIAKLIGTHG
jgi:signal transduction histidine kinase